MCEFKVFLDGEKVFEEVVRVETTASGVVLTDILGDEKNFEHCYLERVDVASETLVLSSTPIGIKKESAQRKEDLGEVLSAAREFHGHVGPFLIVGIRMGRLALKRLNVGIAQDPRGTPSAVAETGIDPPISCIIDGIQWSTGCTLGKGKIRVEDMGKPSARFNIGEEALRISLKDQVFEKIKESLKAHPFLFEDLNEEVISLNTEDLFDVDHSKGGH